MTQDELEEKLTELVSLGETIDSTYEYGGDETKYRAEAEKVKAEIMAAVALMRQALEAVEWSNGDNLDSRCLWCGALALYEPHEPDCLRQRALGLIP